MSRIIEEGKNKFQNIKKIESEFNKVRRELDRLSELNEEKNSKQYDFMEFLINETKNLTYLEYTLSKMPSLVNVKDKEEQNKEQKKIVEEDEEEFWKRRLEKNKSKNKNK